MVQYWTKLGNRRPCEVEVGENVVEALVLISNAETLSAELRSFRRSLIGGCLNKPRGHTRD